MSTAEREVTAPIVGPAPYTDDWYAIRPSVIGASEAAAACGVSEWKQPLDLYLEKTGRKAAFGGNDRTRRGKRFEPFIAGEYELQTGRSGEVNTPLLRHRTHQHIAATVDWRAGGDNRIAEFKACNWRQAAKLGEEGTDDVFPDWLMQAHQGMLVTGADACDIFVMVDLHTYRLFEVQRHDGICEGIISAETELMQRIEEQDPPPPNFEHPSTPALIETLYGSVNSGEVVPLSDDISAKWSEYQRLGGVVKHFQEQRDALKAEVLYAMGEACVGLLPGGDYEVTRSAVKESQWTQADIDDLAEKVGQVKRRGYVRLGQRKVRKPKGR